MTRTKKEEKSEIESENIWVAGVSLLFLGFFFNSERFEIFIFFYFVKVMLIIVEVIIDDVVIFTYFQTNDCHFD